MKSNKAVIRKWVRAFNSGDAALAASCYHDKAVNLQVAIGKPLEGKQAIFEDMKSFFAAIPDNSTRIVNLFEDGDWVILEWIGGGTFHKTKRSKGRRFEVEGCGFFKFRAGKIIFQRGYWDMAKWDAQING
jgi:steroid delta-isomerase-like uncharacterized protein